MSGVNKAIIIGHLGRDPEVRDFQNGGQVMTLRVATSESWKDRTSGERKERTEWHTVAIFAEPLIKFAQLALRKGSKVYIEGKLQTRKWQAKDGSDRYATEIVLQGFNAQLVPLDKREGDPGRHDYSQHQDEGRWQGSASGGASPGTGAGAAEASADLDDDVPF